MYYCNIKKSDIADGPGVRVTLFVSGRRCRKAHVLLCAALRAAPGPLHGHSCYGRADGRWRR